MKPLTFWYPSGIPGASWFAAWMTMWWWVGQFYALEIFGYD